MTCGPTAGATMSVRIGRGREAIGEEREFSLPPVLARIFPGMSFAIPINMARALIDQMLEFGDIRRGALGFTYNDFTSSRSRDLV
jgi:S1-C subfamily serine protease